MYQKEFVYKEFLRKEENILRAPYNPELEFYSVIKSGNIEKISSAVPRTEAGRSAPGASVLLDTPPG